MKVALVAIARQENNYIREWIEYYKNVGIDKIIVGDNNFNDEEQIEPVIKDYIESGFVDLKNERDKTTIQNDFYNRMYKEYKDQYDWICFFDIDEFLVFSNLIPSYNIKDYLSLDMFNDYDVVKINWLLFGDNDITFDGNYNVINRFKNPVQPIDFRVNINGNYIFPHNLMIKSIVRCKENVELDFDVHYPKNKDLRFCDSCGEEEKAFQLNNAINYKYVQLNHYITKTLDEYIQKINRGEPTGVQSKREKIEKLYRFFDYNFNNITREKIFKVRDYIISIL